MLARGRALVAAHGLRGVPESAGPAPQSAPHIYIYIYIHIHIEREGNNII